MKKLPPWFRQDIPDSHIIRKLKVQLSETGLSTVCQSARCPNLGICWKENSATFMILGDHCTRECRFCAVTNAAPREIDPREPEKIMEVVSRLGLQYVVITSVTRDDLPDGGAHHFAQTIKALKRIPGLIGVEALIPDFQGNEDSLEIIVKEALSVCNHNCETVERLTPQIRKGADYQRSLRVLERAKQFRPSLITKSGFMVGLGETEKEIISLMRDIALTGCDILTIGQYLSPSQGERHLPVDRFASPQQFDNYRSWAFEMGFKVVESGPLVRSSYRAKESFLTCRETCQLKEAIA